MAALITKTELSSFSKEIQRLAKLIYNDKIDIFTFDEQLFNNIRRYYTLKYSNSGINLPSNLKLKFKENILNFAKGKTNIITSELFSKLNINTDDIFSSGKKILKDYLLDAEKLNIKYNQIYNNVETQYIISSMQGAETFEQLYPLQKTHYLVYHATNDEKTREDHMALDGIALPFDDPFWDSYYPPDWDWNCRCYVTAEDKDDTSYQEMTKIYDRRENLLQNKQNTNSELCVNSAKTGKIFNDEHPYLKTNL